MPRKTLNLSGQTQERLSNLCLRLELINREFQRLIGLDRDLRAQLAEELRKLAQTEGIPPEASFRPLISADFQLQGFEAEWPEA